MEKFNLRTVVRFTNNGWKRCSFKSLMLLDNFRLYEDGKLVVGKNGTGNFVATSLPYINKKGQPAIECDELTGR